MTNIESICKKQANKQTNEQTNKQKNPKFSRLLFPPKIHL